MKDVGDNASWRPRPLSHVGLIQRILENGQTVNPLLMAAWVHNGLFRKDWLHCADQGVSRELLGTLFVMLLGTLPGTEEPQLGRFWERLVNYYDANPSVEARLQRLTLPMIRPDGKGPRLKASAAECHALVPFGELYAHELLRTDDAVEHAAILAAAALNQCYASLARGNIFKADILKEQS